MRGAHPRPGESYAETVTRNQVLTLAALGEASRMPEPSPGMMNREELASVSK